MRNTRTASVRDDGRARLVTAFLLGMLLALTMSLPVAAQATASAPQPTTTDAAVWGNP